MVDFSLGEWLGFARKPAPNKARKRRPAQPARIECLEDRALLTAPVAVNDTYVLDEDVTLNGTTVLANDTDVESDTIDEAVLDAGPTNGTLTLNTDGTFTYVPSLNFNGSDSFTYFARTTSNGETSTTAATVTLTVNAQNDTPTVANVNLSTDEDLALNGTLTGLDADLDAITFAEGATAATNGTVTINSNGTFTFTPNADFNGTATFSFVASDGTTTSTEATATITVNALNDVPVANPVGITTDEDAVFNGTLTASDAEGDPLTFSAGAVAATSGTVAINPNGTFTYTPNANFSGSDVFSFKVNDGTGDSIDALVTVVVNPLNDLPIPTNASITTDEDLAVNGTLAATDAEGDPLTFAAGTTTAANGVVTISAGGDFTYTPNANFNGTDSFTFVANDGQGNSTEGTITVTVNALADVPVANPQTISATEDIAFNGTLTGTDADGNPLTFSAGTVAAANGVVTINPGGTFTYTPNANFNGSDSFSFKVNDGTSDSAEATVTVNVAAVNDSPVGTNATVNTTEDTAFNGTLTATDAEGDVLTFAAGSVAAANGVVTINPGGTFTYTPNADFNGTDSFSFVANDGTGNSAEATITVNVAAAADVPVANPQTITATEDIAFNGTLTGTDADGDALTFSAGAVAAANGVVTINSGGTFTYTPNANFSGSDSFSFKVNDGTSDSTEATVTVNVTAVNDVPTVQPVNVTVNEDAAFNGTLTGTDAEGDALTFSAGAVAAANGTVTINPNGTFTYTPNANFSGTDTFTYRANDGTGNSADGTVTVTVTALNDLPVPTNASITTAQNTAFNGQLAATDAENDTLTFAAGTTAATNGTVTINPNGTFTYTPNAGFNGTDSFTFVVNDGTGNSTEGTISVTVTATTGVPTANNAAFSTPVDTVLNGSLTGTDPNGDPLTFSAGTTAPAHGTLTINANGNFTFTPTAGFTGTDTFTFKVNDGTSDSAEATVTINIGGAVNTAPVVTNGTGTTTIGAALNASLSSLATDAEGDNLTFTAITQPANGTLSLSADGNFIYTPNAGFSGTDTFTFRANDGSLDSNVGTLTITVNDAPFSLDLSTTPGVIALKKKLVVPLDPTATLTNVDPSVDFANATITASITAGASKKDQILITDGGGIDRRGKKIRFNGVEVARLSGGKKNSPLVVSFNGSATVDAVNAVLQSIGLKTTKSGGTGTRTVQLQVSAAGFTSTGTIDANVVV